MQQGKTQHFFKFSLVDFACTTCILHAPIFELSLLVLTSLRAYLAYENTATWHWIIQKAQWTLCFVSIKKMGPYKKK